MQREVTVQDGEIVIRVNGASVRYPLSVVQKRVKELSVELDTWQEYERRLLTPRALDGATVAEFCECGISIESHTGVYCIFRPASNANRWAASQKERNHE